jgi:hypothetical protein
MRDSLSHRLLHREIHNSTNRSTLKAIYGHLNLVRDLDIVDELSGHEGCVNALRFVIMSSVSESDLMMNIAGPRPVFWPLEVMTLALTSTPTSLMIQPLNSH